jgi:putative transposase
MRSHSELYVHLVWATWDRTPWLVAEVRPAVYRCISEQARKLEAEALAIGGIADHVHALVRYPARISVAELAMHLKGAPSRFATADLHVADPFRRQGSYGAFSVSRRGIPKVRAYIADQERHHADGTVIHALELTTAPEPAKAGLVSTAAPAFRPRATLPPATTSTQGAPTMKSKLQPADLVVSSFETASVRPHAQPADADFAAAAMSVETNDEWCYCNSVMPEDCFGPSAGCSIEAK